MRRYLFSLLLPTALVVSPSACCTSALRLDYRALAHASVRLGMDTGIEDNHKLYLGAAQWIGIPYREGGEAKRGTDCSGMACQAYKKAYHIKSQRSTNGRKKKGNKITRRDLWEGDLVSFSSQEPRRKVTHVNTYFKDGKFVHANTSQGVIVSSLNEPYYRAYWISGDRVCK